MNQVLYHEHEKVPIQTYVVYPDIASNPHTNNGHQPLPRPAGRDFFGRPLVGHFNVITACCYLTGIDILALWLPFNYYPSHTGLIVFALLYGFVSGAFVSLLMPCAAKSGTLETLCQRFGTFQAVISVSTLTGLPIMGSIVTRQGGDDFTGLVIFSGASCLLGASLLAVSTLLLRRKLGTWKV